MTSVTTMSFTTRRLLLAFVVHAFQSLDVAFVKKELATLAQIHIWAGLSSEERRNAEFEKHPPLRKIWRGSLKRFDASGTATPMNRRSFFRCKYTEEIAIRTVLVVQFNN